MDTLTSPASPELDAGPVDATELPVLFRTLFVVEPRLAALLAPLPPALPVTSDPPLLLLTVVLAFVPVVLALPVVALAWLLTAVLVVWEFVAVASEGVPLPVLAAPAADVPAAPVVVLVEPVRPVELAAPLVLLAVPALLTVVLAEPACDVLDVPPLFALPVEALVAPELPTEVLALVPCALTSPLWLVALEMEVEVLTCDC